jgi:hypothetical protein
MSAQTALRESIGRHELAQMITERETLGRELQCILDEKTNPWGITVQSVEVRDVRYSSRTGGCDIPAGTSRAGTAGTDHPGTGRDGNLRKIRAGCGSLYREPHRTAPQGDNMLYEAIKERGSMVIVPSSSVETMGLGGSLATASLAGNKT